MMCWVNHRGPDQQGVGGIGFAWRNRYHPHGPKTFPTHSAVVAPSERSAATALATLMGSRGRCVSSHSASVGLTARVTATSMLLGQRHPRARGQMLHQVPGEQREDVQRRPTALAD